MNLQEVIAQKMLKTWPESWKIFEDSCQYSIDNGLSYIKGILLNKESPIDHNNYSIVCSELLTYLTSFQYENVVVGSYTGQFQTIESGAYKSGLDFIVFLSKPAIEKYIQEGKRWEKWYREGSWGTQPSKPFREEIRYLDIYKDKRNGN